MLDYDRTSVPSLHFTSFEVRVTSVYSFRFRPGNEASRRTVKPEPFYKSCNMRATTQPNKLERPFTYRRRISAWFNLPAYDVSCLVCAVLKEYKARFHSSSCVHRKLCLQRESFLIQEMSSSQGSCFIEIYW